MRRGGSVERVVAAEPERLYALIADVTRVGEWSPECHSCRWLGDVTEAEAGARFLDMRPHLATTLERLAAAAEAPN